MTHQSLSSMENKKFRRLPKFVEPVNYNIQLTPDLVNFTFAGKEIIDVKIAKKTKSITLNSADIQVSKCLFRSVDKEWNCNNIKYKAEDETVTFEFDIQLPLGDGKLEVVFTGYLNDKMKGFYRSKYTSISGNESFCAVTQFEPTDARRAFPCWDEPAIKATFDITIIAMKNRVVLSNMDIEEEKDSDECDALKIVKFKRTPIMSTYLVAFVVGEFDYIEDRTCDGVIVRVYTPIGKTEQGKFALEIALKTLPFYNDFFGIPYPLPKMDLIAIPDFSAGAMENWGLITYRETCLLVDSKESSAASKQWVALVVGHEIAHQWFGNLTTMEWWTHLWLNEGFASFVEYMCVNHCFPEYDIWTQFVTNDFTKALDMDALSSSHPIEVEVGHPSEIDEIFDAISYSKGASVIRMLHDYIGEKAFQQGLNSYLTTLQYKNAITEDLWDHLERASKKPVERVMSTWTKQMGYPIISVTSEHVQSKRILKISQRKFTSDGSEDANKTMWAVPIAITSSKSRGQKEHHTLLSDPEMVIFLNDLSPEAWIKLNPGQVSFYRTSYSPEMLKALIPGIPSLSAVDRLGIENDLFALAMACVSETVHFLNILDGYTQEENYTVWSDIDSNLAHLSLLVQNTDSHDLFKSFVCHLYKPVFLKIGWECADGENHLVPMLRSLLVRGLGKYCDSDVVEAGKKKFESHVDGSAVIPADLRAAIYSLVQMHGNEQTFDQLVTLFKNTTHMEEKNRILRCLGNSSNPLIISKALNFALSNEVRAQDTVFALAGCTGSLEGRKMTWQFTKDHWDELFQRYDGGFLLSRLVKLITENFATEAELKDVQLFFDLHKVPSVDRAIKQSLESIELNRKWLQHDKDNVIAWLQKRYNKIDKALS